MKKTEVCFPNPRKKKGGRTGVDGGRWGQQTIGIEKFKKVGTLEIEEGEKSRGKGKVPKKKKKREPTLSRVIKKKVIKGGGRKGKKQYLGLSRGESRRVLREMSSHLKRILHAIKKKVGDERGCSSQMAEPMEWWHKMKEKTEYSRLRKTISQW